MSRGDDGPVDADLLAGVRDVSPLMLGIVPFALVAGIAAVDAGFSLAEALGLSVVVFAGASQLAALDLLGADAPLAVVVGTAVVINLRMVMYSASIAPYFSRYPSPSSSGHPTEFAGGTTSGSRRRCGSSGRPARSSASPSVPASPTRGDSRSRSRSSSSRYSCRR
jgi:hypothetical protein